jgi:hypothetical protein
MQLNAVGHKMDTAREMFAGILSRCRSRKPPKLLGSEGEAKGLKCHAPVALSSSDLRALVSRPNIKLCVTAVKDNTLR